MPDDNFFLSRLDIPQEASDVLLSLRVRKRL